MFTERGRCMIEENSRNIKRSCESFGGADEMAQWREAALRALGRARARRETRRRTRAWREDVRRDAGSRHSAFGYGAPRRARTYAVDDSVASFSTSGSAAPFFHNFAGRRSTTVAVSELFE